MEVNEIGHTVYPKYMWTVDGHKMLGDFGEHKIVNSAQEEKEFLETKGVFNKIEKSDNPFGS